MDKTEVSREYKKENSASLLYKDGLRCSQAMLLAYAEKFNLDLELASKIATGFGGGISRLGEICGAVTGAVMVIGLKFGQKNAKDEKAKEITYYFVEEFVDQFRSRYNSIQCRELLGIELSTPEGQKRFKEEKLNETICRRIVTEASEILAGILNSWDDND